MAQPYVGEIRMFAGNFNPAGWMFCDGSLLAISEYDTLFNLIGTTYGGDGQNTFALPDLRGRVLVHQGQGISNYIIGESGGVETVTLTTQQIPVHTHTPGGSNSGTAETPANNFWGNTSTAKPYGVTPPNQVMNPATIGIAGSSQPHNNMIPFLCINYIISLFGIYPTQ
ncbi:MAG TPA: tail fiber protein [Ferruginibacter sp.]|jgi:microcystin-dependent protein|nr:tail fiber protein [Ferruginibacter sp.]